ncbi:MAG: hypothetical protein V3R55_01470 [Alphaproteobacteria bacterium]
MTDDAHPCWFQDPDAWVAHCTEVYHLANSVALPVIAAVIEKPVGTRVDCVLNTDRPPHELAQRLRAVARTLHELAGFLKDAAESGLAEGDFKPAVRGSDAVQ